MLSFNFNQKKEIGVKEVRVGTKTIVEAVNYPVRLTYAGRLDKDSDGLIILTNDGELIQRMMKGSNGHEKEYLVTIDRPVTEEIVRKMAGGGIPVFRPGDASL